MRRTPLRTYAPLRRKTPLRASKITPTRRPTGNARRQERARPDDLHERRGASEELRRARTPESGGGTYPAFPKPSRARNSRGANPKVGGEHGPRSSKRSHVGSAADAKSLVASQGQQQTVGLMFAKPARRKKAAPAPLRRSPMRKKLPRRLDGPGSDPGRLEWCRHQLCVGVTSFPDHMCSGPIDPSHLRNHTGAGRKEPDSQTCPKCRDLHRQWEERRGYFAGWSNEKRLTWMLLRIAETESSWQGLTATEREVWQERARARRAAA